MSFPAWEGTVALFIVAEEQPARKARHCAAGVLFTSTPTPFCLAVVSCYIAGRRFFFFFFYLPVVAVLPTPGTGILVNSGQTLEVGCPFLSPYVLLVYIRFDFLRRGGCCRDNRAHARQWRYDCQPQLPAPVLAHDVSLVRDHEHHCQSWFICAASTAHQYDLWFWYASWGDVQEVASVVHSTHHDGRPLSVVGFPECSPGF